MGLTGIQTTVPLLFSEGVVKRGLPLTEFARLTAAGPAALLGLYPKKRNDRAGKRRRPGILRAG